MALNQIILNCAKPSVFSGPSPDKGLSCSRVEVRGQNITTMKFQSPAFNKPDTVEDWPARSHKELRDEYGVTQVIRSIKPGPDMVILVTQTLNYGKCVAPIW